MEGGLRRRVVGRRPDSKRTSRAGRAVQHVALAEGGGQAVVVGVGCVWNTLNRDRIARGSGAAGLVRHVAVDVDQVIVLVTLDVAHESQVSEAPALGQKADQGG